MLTKVGRHIADSKSSVLTRAVAEGKFTGFGYSVPLPPFHGLINMLLGSASRIVMHAKEEIAMGLDKTRVQLKRLFITGDRLSYPALILKRNPHVIIGLGISWVQA